MSTFTNGLMALLGIAMFINGVYMLYDPLAWYFLVPTVPATPIRLAQSMEVALEEHFQVRLIDSDEPNPTKPFLSLGAAVQFAEKRINSGVAERAEIYQLLEDGTCKLIRPVSARVSPDQAKRAEQRAINEALETGDIDKFFKIVDL
jgi:hypothetical protein